MLNINSLYCHGVFFSEKPVTTEERAVSKTLQNLYHARQEKNVPLILSLFSKTARIKLWSEDKNDLASYKIFLERTIPNHISTCFDQIFIQTPKSAPPHAYITTTYKYTTQTFGPKRLVFEFEMKEGHCLISKIEFVD